MRLFCALMATLHALSLAGKETNQVGNETNKMGNETTQAGNKTNWDYTYYKFYVRNACYTEVRLAIRYKSVWGLWGQEWSTQCWWYLRPGQEFYLAMNDINLETTTRRWYYFAESTQNNYHVWAGSDNYKSCDGRRLGMRKKTNVLHGDLDLKLTCVDPGDKSGEVGEEDGLEEHVEVPDAEDKASTQELLP